MTKTVWNLNAYKETSGDDAFLGNFRVTSEDRDGAIEIIASATDVPACEILVDDADPDEVRTPTEEQIAAYDRAKTASAIRGAWWVMVCYVSGDQDEGRAIVDEFIKNSGREPMDDRFRAASIAERGFEWGVGGDGGLG